MKKFFGSGPTGIDSGDLHGRLIVIEGADGAGRSTHIRRLTAWLEERGHAVVTAGLMRSELVCEELNSARRGNSIGLVTRSLFYATDLADQMERVIVPALRGGMVVLCDRYIYTLIARDLCRNAELAWLENLYGFAIVPDQVVYLKVSPKVLARRVLTRDGELDYWESGMDLAFSHDRYESFVRYQEKLATNFDIVRKNHSVTEVNGQRSPADVQADLRAIIEPVLKSPALPIRATGTI